MVKNLFTKTPRSGWMGNYSSWDSALKNCDGYDKLSIVEKIKTSVMKVKNGEAVYERDSVIFNELYLFEPIVKALSSSVEGDRLHVLDLGGSLGSVYFQHRHLFKHLNDLKWSVVEQEHYVNIGKKDISEGALNFYHTIEEALANQSNQTLLLSSVLQYLPDPYEVLNKLLAFDFKYIIIDRTAFINNAQERLTVQIVPEEIYKASYPAWFFNEHKLLDVLLKKYSIVNEFINDIPLPTELDGQKVYWKGFYLKRKNG